MKKSITWEEFEQLWNTTGIYFDFGEDGEVHRMDFDAHGVDVFCAKGSMYYRRALNQVIDVDGNDLILIDEDGATLLSVYDVKPHEFK